MLYKNIRASSYEKNPGQHVVVVTNTVQKDPYDARFLPKLMNYLKESPLVARVTLVSSDKEFRKTIGSAPPIDRIILGGSQIHIHQLDHHDPKTVLNKNIITQALHQKKGNFPAVLGICFGAQFINSMMGGTLEGMDDIMCKFRSVCWDASPFPKKDCYNYMFCLKFMIKDLGRGLYPRARLANSSSLKKYAKAEKGKVVAFSHQDPQINIHGVLFHPEDGGPKGKNTEGERLLDEFILHGGLQ